MSRAPKFTEHADLAGDVLYDIRRAMRILRRAERYIAAQIKAEKRRRAKSDEWNELRKIKAEAQTQHCA